MNMIEHNDCLYTSGEKSIFRKYETEYGDMEDEMRLVFSQTITDMKFHPVTNFYFMTTSKGKIVKIRSTFTEK